jgi:adenylate cyclase
VVNTASRLEGKTKDFRVQLVVSEDVLTRAGIDPRDGARHEVTVRGRVEPMHIRAIENA